MNSKVMVITGGVSGIGLASVELFASEGAQMSRMAAAELSPRNTRVNAICPGMIATSIFGASFGLPRESADRLAKQIAEKAETLQPIPKAGMPEDVALTALYLASDASAFVTGTHIVVDGGITVGSRHSWDLADTSPLVNMQRELLTAAGA